MNPRKAGFLLLKSKLGNPERKVLTDAQIRTLYLRVSRMERPGEDRELMDKDLIRLGYGPDFSRHVVELLEEEALLSRYLQRAERAGCRPLTPADREYPSVLLKKLGPEAPVVLWARGDISILRTPMVSLVGSRELKENNRAFAREAGRQAALQGYTLVSGNARGADRTAQDACLEAGGQVVSIIADQLADRSPCPGILYLSEGEFDEDFSAQRALHRNRTIHAMGERTLVAQCTYQKGGTWDGSVKNLRFGWSPVYVYDDGSPAAALLDEMGAQNIGFGDLRALDALPVRESSFL